MPQTVRFIEREAPRTILQRAMESIRSYTVGPLSTAGYEGKLLAKLFGAGYETASGVSVSDQNAFTFSAVFDAVNQGSSDVAKLPLDLRKRRKEGGSDPYTASKVYKLLKYEANPDMGAMDFRRTLQAHAMTLKAGFAEIERNGAGDPVALWPLTPDRVQPVLKKTTLASGRFRTELRYQIDGDTRNVIDGRDMIHIRGLGYDGYLGYAVVDKARQAIGLALASEKFAGAFFGNNANLGGVLAAESDIDEPQAKDIQDRIEKIHRGPDRAWRMLVLGAGFKYFRTGVTPSESQMNDLRSRQVEEVARFFNFPVHKLKNLDRATNNNVEHLDLDYYKSFLLTWITTWEQELNRKLIPPLEVYQQYVKHNVYAFLRGDTEAQANFFTAMLDRGVYCADDVLELMDMNPQPDGQGKLYLVQGAMVPKDKVSAIAESQIEKNKRPKTAPAPPAPTPVPGDPDERAARAETLAREAQEAAQRERDARVAAETAGTATATELARLREVEQAATTRAAQVALVVEQLRAEQQQASEARAALVAQLRDAHAERDAAVAATAEARRLADVAAADLRTAEARVTAATETAAEATRAAERHEREAGEARAVVAAAGDDRLAVEEARRLAEIAAAEARTRAELLDAERVTLSQTSDQLRAAAEEARLASERAAVQAQGDLAAAQTRIAAIEAALQESEAGRATLETARAAATLAEQQASEARVAAEIALEAARTAAETYTRLASEQDTARAAAEAVAAECRATVAAREADLQAAIAAHERALADQQQQAEAHRARAASLETVVADRDRTLTELRQADAGAIAEVIAAHRALVADIMRRMIERETDRARTHQNRPEKFRQWVATFYDTHAEVMRQALLPAIRVHLAFIRSSEPAIDATRRIVDAHVAESTRQIGLVLEGDAESIAASLPALWYRWDTERTTVLADALMAKELDYGRRL